MLAINVYAEPTTWPKTFTNGDYEYKIEGNKLIIKDSLGKDVEYIRK